MTTLPTNEDLRKMLEEATPGSWSIVKGPSGKARSVSPVLRWDVFRQAKTTQANAALIALAPTLARELIELRERNRWIPVSEKLPELKEVGVSLGTCKYKASDSVLVRCGAGWPIRQAHLAWWDDLPKEQAIWIADIGGDKFQGVTHWRLADPPENGL